MKKTEAPRILNLRWGGPVIVMLILQCAVIADDGLRSELEVPIAAKKDLVFREVDGVKIRADLFRPANDLKLPLVMMVHGGAWSAGDKWELTDHARELAQAGFVALSINYRLAPISKLDRQLDDCRFAAQWAVEQAEQWNADPQRFALWGYSAGAHLVSLLALNPSEEDPPVRAVVAGGTPCDFSFVPADSPVLSHVLGGTRADLPEVYERYSPVNFANQDAPPFFIFHGSSDVLVPQSCSLKMARALQQHQVEAEFYNVEGKGHLLSFLDPEARRKAIQFLHRHLQE